MVRKTSTLVCWLSIIVLTAFVPAAQADLAQYAQVFKEEDYLAAALLQIATGDFNGDGLDELLVSARNYETRERRLYMLKWQGNAFAVIWQSENLFEEASHLTLAVGHFTGNQLPEAIVVTEASLRVYRWNGQSMQQVWKGANPFAVVGDMVAVRNSAYERDLLAVTKVAKQTDTTAYHYLQFYAWEENRFVPVSKTDSIGRIRALAAGDITGDADDEIAVEIGLANEPGIVQIWHWTGSEYEFVLEEGLSPAAAFGLSTGYLGTDERGVVVADDRGYVTLYSVGARRFTKESTVTVGWGVVDAAIGDITGDGLTEIMVLGYPNRLHLLKVVD